MDIELKRLQEIPPAEIIDLMTHPRLRRHMPLLGPTFDEAACRDFVEGKERARQELGYGVWAFCCAGKFVGWGGIQDEDGDPDVGIVLHPDHWGLGPVIMRILLREAFRDLGFSYVTILIPPTRKNVRALGDLGFTLEGEVSSFGTTFLRFRLTRDRFVDSAISGA
jgi:RimJ/RimL family protein N-acetyltransferase